MAYVKKTWVGSENPLEGDPGSTPLDADSLNHLETQYEESVAFTEEQLALKADSDDLGTAAALDVAVTGNAAAGEVVKGNDTRLSDARTPLTHTHTAAQITNFDTAVDSRVAAAFASPAFTGNPTVPTAAPGDSDNTIASTAFVSAAVAASGGGADGGVNTSDVGFDIIIAIGQSNMSKSGGPVLTDIYDIPDPRVWQYAASGTYAGKIIRGIDPLVYPAADLGTEVAPPMQFAREWVKRVPSNRQVLIVPAAVGGSSLIGGPWAVGGSYYNQAISLANAAVTAAGPNSRVAAFLWIQGEAESVSGAAASSYIAAFDPMIAGLRAAITGASSAPFVVGSMVPEWRNLPNGTSLAIHAAHVATPTRVANSFFVDGPTGMNEDTGGIHYNAEGMREMGKRMCAALFATPSIPGQVTGLTVTSSNASAVLSWNSISAIPTVTDYMIQYRPTSGGAWTTFADAVSTITSATVTGLTNGTSYDFQVAAVNAEGTGTYSATVTTTPQELPSPLYLVDARTLGLSDGASVTTWPDTSTNPVGPDVTQATSTSRPTYRAAGLNGRPSLEFDGGDSLGITTPQNATIDASGDYTVVAVFSVDAFGSNRGIFAHRSDTPGTFHLNAQADATISFSTLNGSVSNASSPAITAGTPVCVVATRDDTGAKLYVNGVKGTDGAAGATTALGTNYPFTVGRVSNSLWTHDGHISYLAIYPGVLTPTQRGLVQTALMTDFGIS